MNKINFSFFGCWVACALVYMPCIHGANPMYDTPKSTLSAEAEEFRINTPLRPAYPITTAQNSQPTGYLMYSPNMINKLIYENDELNKDKKFLEELSNNFSVIANSKHAENQRLKKEAKRDKELIFNLLEKNKQHETTMARLLQNNKEYENLITHLLKEKKKLKEQNSYLAHNNRKLIAMMKQPAAMTKRRTTDNNFLPDKQQFNSNNALMPIYVNKFTLRPYNNSVPYPSNNQFQRPYQNPSP